MAEKLVKRLEREIEQLRKEIHNVTFTDEYNCGAISSGTSIKVSTYNLKSSWQVYPICNRSGG